ncbi:MAG TPA: hypothetical protein DEH25_13925 [Chloroflexi bacterium]|nr:hypothetical protein [Chloroflexota bacterium]
MPNWLEVVVNVLVTLTMLVGLFGLVIPIFPGNVVMWVAALIYGIAFGFGVKGLIIFILLTILTIIAALADNLLMGAKAREKGASWLSIFMALGAGVLFTLIFPPFGGIIAAPVVLFASEYLRLKDRGKALEVMRALLAGWGWSFVVRFGIGIIMLILWIIWTI